jgi:hypothetical protein
MSGDHTKREIVTGDKPTSSGKIPSRESSNKYKMNPLPPSSHIGGVTRRQRR